MTIFWTGGGPGLQSPAVFIELQGSNPPTRPPVGTRVRVKNAETGVELTSFYDADGDPASQVSTLADGYVIFGVDDVPVVDISADNWTTITRLVMTTAVMEAATLSRSAATLARDAAYGALALRPLRAALAGRLEARAKIVVIGDSNAEGQGASPNSRRWVSRLQQSLRNAYGISGGGVGFLPAYTDSYTITQPGVVDTSPSGAAANKDTRYGLGGRSYQLIKAAAITYSQVCTSFVVHYARDTYGTLLKVIVDGTQIATIDTNGTNGGGYTWTSPPLPSGLHTVRLENADATVGYGTIVSGVDFRNGDESSGITVYDGSHFGWQTSSFTAEHDKSLTAVEPDAIVHALGANDAVAVSAATFKTNLTARVARGQPAVTREHSVIFLAHVARADTTVEPWANYVRAMREVAAATENGFFLDLGERMPAIAGDQLGLYDGGVHFSNRGHALVDDVVFSAIVPGGAGGGTSSSGSSGGTGGAVASVNGRIGAVELDAAAVGAAAASHAHSAAQITSGVLSIERAHPGAVTAVLKSGTSWPARPTSRTDVTVLWIGAEPGPALVSSGTGGMHATDGRLVTA